MADDGATDRGHINLGFYSGAFPDSAAFQLVGVEGREEISRLFEFQLLLVRLGAALTDGELEDVVRKPCVIALGKRPGDLVHGIITRIEHLDSTRDVHPVYVATMVPQVALLDLGLRSAIYQDQTVPQIVASILSDHGMANGKGFDIRVTEEAKSPTREYVVQYKESDWAFIQRWLEHEGYFYWFEHGKRGARLVVADANDDATRIDDPSTIPYRERNNLATKGTSTIWDFRVEQRRVPQRVTVVDYNHRRPTEMIVSTKVIDEGGFGHVFHYGEHVKDRDISATMTRIRAEGLAADRRRIHGVSDCARFRVGHVFTLENHHVPAYDGDYLITAIDHRAGLPVGTAREGSAIGEGAATHYKATFDAIPLRTPFRPERRTPWPRIHGVINGHVEADTSGDYAQIDDQGRYKIKMPFDVGTRKGLASSRWVRMAQSYAGAGYGQHFPLHKGTEVLIAHVDGDPDRPVIVGSVPNAATPGPVASGNATQSVMQTASGIRVEIEDRQG